MWLNVSCLLYISICLLIRTSILIMIRSSETYHMTELTWWHLSQLRSLVSREAVINDTIQVHYGKCSVFWCLTNTRHQKSEYLGLCCFDFDHSFYKLSLVCPPTFWRWKTKSPDCPFNTYLMTESTTCCHFQQETGETVKGRPEEDSPPLKTDFVDTMCNWLVIRNSESIVVTIEADDVHSANLIQLQLYFRLIPWQLLLSSQVSFIYIAPNHNKSYLMTLYIKSRSKPYSL